MQQIQTEDAPAAIGSYSQAIKVGQTVYLSGQIPLDPNTMQLVGGEMSQQVQQVFENIQSVARAAGGNLTHVVQLTVYLLDLSVVAVVNDMIARYFVKPYPARTTIQVSALPMSAAVEIAATMVLPVS